MYLPHTNAVHRKNASTLPSVLIVENDLDIRDIISFILTDSGHEVLKFHSCPDHDTIFDFNPDVILLDEPIIGSVSESQICRSLKNAERIAHIPVVILTTNCRAAEIACSSGADDFLQKPFDIDELSRKVSKFVGNCIT